MSSARLHPVVGLVILLSVARSSAAQSPQYVLLDAWEDDFINFQIVSPKVTQGGHVVVRVQLSEGRSTREWDTQNGWRDVAGPAGFPYTDAGAVNASGVIVGRAFNSAGDLHAFVWIDGVTFDLNALGIDGADGWSLEYANDINDNGMILGRGRVAGRPHDFVLLPTYP